jgi:(5-formylfuran-3-yl)methyl phosphate synthase
VRLLVSVSNTQEAAAAADGGADIIDAKDPLHGALGAVTAAMFDDIRRAVDRPTSAALGDARTAADVERDARAFREAGAAFVKLGFAGTAGARDISRLLAAAVRGAGDGVVAVAYADHDRAGSIGPDALVGAAARAGVAGILLDTADKQGPGVCHLFTQSRLGEWIVLARDAGLFVAVAGRLTINDLSRVRDAGADIAGVRGAACVHGRTGPISSDRVRALRTACA